MSGSDFDVFGIFSEEAAEQIKKLTDGILKLEKTPSNMALLTNAMRDAHTLKGAARAIRFNSIKELAHRLEDLFNQAQNGTLTFTTDLVTPVLTTLDLIQSLLNNADKANLQEKPPEVEQMLDLLKVILDHPEQPERWGLEQAINASAREGTPISSDQTPDSEHLSPPHSVDSNTQTDESLALLEEAHPSIPQSSQDQTTKEPTDPSTQASPSSTQPASAIFQIEAAALDRMLRQTGELKVTQQLSDELVKQFKSYLEQSMRLSSQLDKLNYHATEGIVDLSFSAAMKQIRTTQKGLQETIAQGVQDIEHLSNRLFHTSNHLDDEVVNARLKTLADILGEFPRMVRDLALEHGKHIELEIRGDDVKLDKTVLDVIRVPMLHLLRNAIGHGIELPDQRTQQGKTSTGKLCISASQAEGQIFIEMRDDGCGINPQSILDKVIERGDLTEETAAKLSSDELMQFLFLPGFSTAKEVTDLSGRGVGLDIVKSEVEAIGGKIQVRSQPGEFTAFSLEFPATISLTPTLAVVGGHSDIFGKQIYLLPVNQIVGLFPNHQPDTLLVEDRQMFKFNDRFVPYCELRNLFQQQALPDGCNQTMVVLGTSGQYAALLVEAVLHEENVIVQSCDARIGKLQDISGVATLRNGKGALMLDIHDLLNTIREQSRIRGNHHPHHTQQAKNCASTILVVEDSATVRELMKQMLTANGYQVVTAVDGQDGLHKFEQANVDLVVSDIDMPRMNGFEMVRQLRATKKNAQVPILMLSYKERDQDKQTAFQVGANDYLTKAEFDKGVILHAIERHLSKGKQRGRNNALAG